MDDSWRMPSPTRHFPPRRSAEDGSNHRRKCDCFDPEDFNDVFGGPPRTVLSRQFSARGFPARASSAEFFYEEIFRPVEKAAPVVRKSGRSLPQFKIPDQQRRRDHGIHGRETYGFYSDIFGWEDEQSVVRSRSRSKASSSSVISSEDLSPLRPEISIEGGDEITFFASQLRPINVKSRWNSRRRGHEDQRSHQDPRQFAGNQPIHSTDNGCPDSLTSCHFGLSRRNASPETISLEPISNGSFRVSGDASELNSPSSVASLVYLSDQEPKIKEQIVREDVVEPEEDEEMSSYVIEINSDYKEGTCESNGVDEAIAWAKEKFQAHCLVQECEEEEKPTEGSKMVKGHQLSDGLTESFRSMDEHQQDKWATEEEASQLESMQAQTEMQIIDEKIQLWSTGKETDIRLLLSSLHHILWPNSGWIPVPLTNIIEISQVKKAYQKARLCLHPDKLQQRGATRPQKYIAKRAFSILQDAWASFLSQDVF